ncbi:MAG: hypothetical protein HY703_06180 [Gemmatimonadetes bacterium]|nr:hypothetical protein [Gemmatimonadota bacterium]
MPIHFRDAEQIESLGSAGFLRFLPLDNDGTYLGALFLVNARSEPLEFSYNRIDVPQRFLWRKQDLRRHIARRLAASLFEICPRVPSVLLCLADEVEVELFSEELELSVPAARLAAGTSPVGQAAGEEREVLSEDEPVQVFWIGGRPPDEAPARRMVLRLAARGLLIEPFERAATGLREVYRLEAKEDEGVVGSTTSA